MEIIGEATNKLDDNLRLKYSEIEWKKISGMRDKLIHDHIGVDLCPNGFKLRRRLKDGSLESPHKLIKSTKRIIFEHIYGKDSRR